MSSNVRVVIRIRPNKFEDGEPCIETVGDEEVQLYAKSNESFRYKFDATYDETTTQDHLFQTEFHGFLSNLIGGVNTTVFCYGITGSGKTHTMQGSEQDPGMTPKSVGHVFDLIEETGNSSNYSTKMSFFEIYNDKVFDLLSKTAQDRIPLQVREDAKKEIIVQNLSEIPFSSSEEFDRIYSLGCLNRKTGSNGINVESSRSHAVLRIRLTYRDSTKSFQSKLNLIDLAGSEDNRRTNNTGARMTESSAINTSLFVLAQVVDGLKKGSTRIPYRDSALTRLLQDSLGGTAHCLMIANIAPGRNHVLNTMRTLEFASNSRQIVNTPVVNEIEIHQPQYMSRPTQITNYQSRPVNRAGNVEIDKIEEELWSRIELKLANRNQEIKNSESVVADAQAYFARIERLEQWLLPEKVEEKPSAGELTPRSVLKAAKDLILTAKTVQSTDLAKALECYRQASALCPRNEKLRKKVESLEKKLAPISMEEKEENWLNTTPLSLIDDVHRSPFKERQEKRRDRYIESHDPYEERDYSILNKKASIEKPTRPNTLSNTNTSSIVNSSTSKPLDRDLFGKPSNTNSINSTINKNNNNNTISKPINRPISTQSSITPQSLGNRPTATSMIKPTTSGVPSKVINNNSNLKPNTTISSNASNNLNKPKSIINQQQTKQNSPVEIPSKQPITTNKNVHPTVKTQTTTRPNLTSAQPQIKTQLKSTENSPALQSAKTEKENVQPKQSTPSPSEKNSSEIILDILNHGNEQALVKLNTIGKKKAEKLIAYRQEKGLFNSVYEIANIEGFGGTFVTNLMLKNSWLDVKRNETT